MPSVSGLLCQCGLSWTRIVELGFTESRTWYHARPMEHAGHRRQFTAECPDQATQEDGYCDWCRAGHPEPAFTGSISSEL
jgi:hypothetical protein